MENHQGQRVVISWWILILVVILSTISHSFVEGKNQILELYKGLNKHKGTVKTIVDPEDGIVIDCVDFYKQPAFDDPRIKSLQLDPRMLPNETKITTNEELKKLGLFQNWHKFGMCPGGTIPIRRLPNRNHRKQPRYSNDLNNKHEYATMRQPFGKYYGGRGTLNVWNPQTEAKEMGVTQMWILGGRFPAGLKDNTVEVGWIVYRNRYHFSLPVNFIYWTGDAYEKTGCYDLDCPGFVKTYEGYAFGAPLSHSVYNDTRAQYDSNVEIFHVQSGAYSSWFLNINGKQIGYWPDIILPNLKDFANTVVWGGEIVNSRTQKHHTTTQMGSGHFPVEGYSRASYVKQIAVMDSLTKWVSESYVPSVTRPDCYGAGPVRRSADFGTHFYYGGPGYSSKCQ